VDFKVLIKAKLFLIKLKKFAVYSVLVNNTVMLQSFVLLLQNQVIFKHTFQYQISYRNYRFVAM